MLKVFHKEGNIFLYMLYLSWTNYNSNTIYSVSKSLVNIIKKRFMLFADPATFFEDFLKRQNFIHYKHLEFDGAVTLIKTTVLITVIENKPNFPIFLS